MAPDKDPKREIEKKLEYAKGYRDALVDTWELVIKLATKGYSSRELQIMSRSQAIETRGTIEEKIKELEADLAQGDIIDADDMRLPEAAQPRAVTTLRMRPGTSYLVKEPKPSRCYEIFESEIASGRPGICVSRRSPREIREDYALGKTKIIWLTTTEKMDGGLPPSALGLAGAGLQADDSDDDYIDPSATGLPLVYSTVLDFLDGNRGGVVLMEGLEYLNQHNTFQAVYHFLARVNENVKRTGSNLVISINPTAFDPKQYGQIETEMGQVL